MSRIRQIAVASFGSMVLLIGLAGCAGDRPDTIGANAVMEASGDKMLTWTASSTGKVTVYDRNTDKIVYGADVTRGQCVKVDIDHNRIMLDNQIVSENSLHGGDQYRIYFEPASAVEGESTIETYALQTVPN